MTINIERNNTSFKFIKIGIASIASIIIITAIFSSMYTIETGTTGVLSTFNKYSDDSVLPGLHFKLPFIQNIKILNTKMQSTNYVGRQDLPDKLGVINKPYISVLDNKNLPIKIDLTVMYTPDADKAAEILGKYGLNYFDKLINPNVRDVVRDVIGKYPAEKIAADRTVIGEELRSKISAKFKKMPFTLNDVSLRNIGLPSIILKKVEEVQLAKQEEQKLSMIEKQAAKKQKIQTIQANTLLIEITTKAKADAEKQKISADAKAYQVEVEANAIAKANIVIAKSITAELISYKAVEKWKGDYPKMLMQGTDSESIIQLPRLGN
jgi:regulator of protease activity HflC (stomatin/prohibitin superfamily)